MFCMLSGLVHQMSGPSSNMNTQIRHGVGCIQVRAITSYVAGATDVVDGTVLGHCCWRVATLERECKHKDGPL